MASERVGLVESGVGKANAAAATAVALAAWAGPEPVVVNLGIAGALPGSGTGLLDRVAATHSVYADEGVEAPDGFTDLAAMGFAPLPGASICGSAPSVGVLGWARGFADHEGVIATVSSCAGTDARAQTVAARTGAVVEAMEGAAVCVTAARLGRESAELRVISNTTGDRGVQQWRLSAALERVGRVAGEVAASVTGR